MFKITGANQAKYDISTGINLIGYVVTNRILRTIVTYAGFNVNKALAAAMVFTVNTYQISSARIPKAKSVLYILSVTIPSGGTAVDVDPGGVIDFVFPAGYVIESFCENEKSSELKPLTPGSFNCVGAG